MDNYLCEKDLHCIARQLQSAWYAVNNDTIPDMFYGCRYCIYQFECSPPGRKIRLHYREVFEKLNGSTGISLIVKHPTKPEKLFLPGSIYLERPGLLPCLIVDHPDRQDEFKKQLQYLLDARMKDTDSTAYMISADHLDKIISLSKKLSDQQ